MSIPATCDELLEQCSAIGNYDPDYFSKMIHAVPPATVVDREQYILGRCGSKRVVNFGSTSGKLHKAIEKVAERVTGVDKDGTPDIKIDLDSEFYSLFILPVADIYVCGELLEHLSNPGSFLRRVKIIMNREPSELLITVPNAFASSNPYFTAKGLECINLDHVCWYSYHSLKVLVERVGFKILEMAWYGPGKPGFNEGLIFLCS